jgi:hypothetical protein
MHSNREPKDSNGVVSHVCHVHVPKVCAHTPPTQPSAVRHLSSSLVISRHFRMHRRTTRQGEATRGNERQGEGGLIDHRSVEDLHPSPLTPRHRHGHRLRAAPCAMTIRTRSSRSRRERFRAFSGSVTRATKSRHVALRCSSLQSGKGWSRPMVRTRCS